MPTVKDTGSNISKEELTSSRESRDSNVKPPSYPELERFTKPLPRMESSLERHYRFSYFFGIDEALFKYQNINKVCGKITRDIEIGKVEKIQLESDHHISKNNSVEFSIIDDENEIPILSIGEEMVRNEKIFFGLPLRFAIDKKKPYYIKKNGEDIDITPESAINSNDGIYTITYHAVDAYEYTPTSESIQVKTVLRMIDEKSEPPFVKNATIKTYGGDALWRDRT